VLLNIESVALITRLRKQVSSFCRVRYCFWLAYMYVA